MTRSLLLLATVVSATLAASLSDVACAQTPRPLELPGPQDGENAAPANADEDTLRLTLQGKVSLTDFIDYVARRLNLQILYDESLREKNINLIAPDPIPVDSLPELLQSILINEGLIVSDTDKQGFKRITTNERIPLVSRPLAKGETLQSVDSAVPVTRVFVLRENKPSEVVELFRPFLSEPGASVIALDPAGLLIITDVARNIRRVEGLLEIVDSGQSRVQVEFVSAENVSVIELSDRLGKILSAKRKAIGMDEESGGGLEVTLEERTNSLVLIGKSVEIEEAKALIERLDQPLSTLQRLFTLRFYSPQALDELIRSLLDDRAIKPPYSARVEGNTLIVESTQEVLDLIADTIRQVDTREAPDSQSPIRFYKIRNVPAQELVETLRGIGGNVTNTGQRRSVTPRSRTSNDLAVPGPNRGPVFTPLGDQGIQEPLAPPALRESLQNESLPFPQIGAIAANEQLEQQQLQFGPTDFPLEGDGLGAASLATDLIGEANVTVDVHTNTIIVVAKPEVQRIYAKLIESLDKRRPQVLLEAKVIIIDTSDNYSLGVEISGGDSEGSRRLFSFSSFGLSTVEPTTGALGIIPGVGFNGTLVDPTTADVVVRALATHTRARVLSTPRILVNDNAEGQLTSVLEVPFTSVNASQTVATTSFAGFAEAGTTITATPTISDDNYLQVDYIVTLNSFTGTGSDGVPPPRQTNEVQSRVTVPDGYTIIVGGLTSQNISHQLDGIPWLERIPIIRDLASLQEDSWQQTSLFVFLKPVILREDRFKDLRYLSDVNLRRSGEPTNFPQNAPLLIE
ncbi:MAG: secretin N-terminal domain-containing protein [Planctomycetota bacterium]